MAARKKIRVRPKTELRVFIVDEILDTLRGDNIFRTLDYRNKSEPYLKQYMHQPLQQRMVKIVHRMDPRLSQKAKEKNAKRALLWEGDVNTTISHTRFLGVQHRPDFVVQLAQIRIAVEVKRGEAGAAVREGLGQSLVYAASSDFDFVVYLFIDVSKDKKILRSLENENDRAFIDSLWEDYNEVEILAARSRGRNLVLG